MKWKGLCKETTRRKGVHLRHQRLDKKMKVILKDLAKKRQWDAVDNHLITNMWTGDPGESTLEMIDQGSTSHTSPLVNPLDRLPTIMAPHPRHRASSSCPFILKLHIVVLHSSYNHDLLKEKEMTSLP